ncbi:MAG: aldo/keto reductase [Bacteroidales bacterium]|nr:aldo/keto reductase [Bacteroidales bacterium]
MLYKETVTLQNNIEMPRIAYGTWQIPDPEVAECVCNAIKAGYRHIDTALAYNNEQGVGSGIRKSGIDRSEIFVTTKIPAEVKSVEGTIESIQTSLKNLKLNYIDLLLIHAPMPWAMIRGAKRYFSENIAVWGIMQKFLAEGKVRAIGVSNFNDQDLQNILKNSNIPPAVNQIKVHPGSSAAVTLKSTLSKKIVPMAYSPLGHGKALGDKYIMEMAKKYGVTPAQICLRYSLQRDCCPVVKTVDPSRMAENLDLDFAISNDDVKFLSCLGTMKNLKKNMS